jgi:hypothetical protein
MTKTGPIDLPRLFNAVVNRLASEQEALNRADSYNHNHGDHMVEIFQVAAEAAAAQSRAGSGAAMAGAMEYAAQLLRQRPENGSAQVYARGLAELAGQFRQRGIGLDELVSYVHRTLHEQVTGEDLPKADPAGSGDVLKALLNALAGWEQAEPETAGPPAGAGQAPAWGSLDLGYLFGVGMAYLQARQKGGDALEILTETVISTSPLARLPHRHRSGKIALRALLEAMN